MDVLFVHNNFPAQYRHIARYLSRAPNVRVAAVGAATATTLPGVNLRRYSAPEGQVVQTHPFARRFDLECRRAEQVLYALTSLTATGFKPDLILAHPGWGETLPLRTIFPSAIIVLYCEFYYRRDGQDVGFDSEFTDVGADGLVNLHLKNAATLLALAESDAGVSPTHWQRATYPQEYQTKISVIHDGVDTKRFCPNNKATFRLPSGRRLTTSDEVITFVARNLEPLRGYHIFARALPKVLEARSKAEVLIIGGSGTSYGRPAPHGTTWRETFFGEIANRLDVARVHFVGTLAAEAYLSALQISSAHVYLTYPFVLSWSLLEAMSAGCLVIASDTGPVKEVVKNNKNGFLVPFFDVKHLSSTIIDCLDKMRMLRPVRAASRNAILESYDLETICLPAFATLFKDKLHLDTVASLIGRVDID